MTNMRGQDRLTGTRAVGLIIKEERQPAKMWHHWLGDLGDGMDMWSVCSKNLVF